MAAERDSDYSARGALTGASAAGGSGAAGGGRADTPSSALSRRSRRFLESGPAPLPGGPVPVGAPFSRILWSVQVGVILLLAGAGLLFLSSRMSSDPALFFMVFRQ